MIEAALEVSDLLQGTELAQSCCVEGEETLWSAAVAVEAHPALATWAQLTLSLLVVSLVSCLCPSACCQLCGDSSLISICRNVPFPWGLCCPGVCRVWGVCGVRQLVLLLSCQALAGVAIWLCSRLYHPRSPTVSVELEKSC